MGAVVVCLPGTLERVLRCVTTSAAAGKTSHHPVDCRWTAREDLGVASVDGSGRPPDRRPQRRQLPNWDR